MSNDLLFQNALSVDPDIFPRLKKASDAVLQEVVAKALEYDKNKKFPTSIRTSSKGGIQSGCDVLFKNYYDSLETTPNEPVYIQLASIKIKTDIEVIKIIKTLLYIGIGHNEELSRVCHNMVMAIIGKQKNLLLTKQDALNALYGEGYYGETLTKVIKDILNK